MNKNKKATDRKQSEELLNAGIPVKTADMYWHDEILHPGCPEGMDYPNVYQAWSADGLIELLPAGTLFLARFRRGWDASFVGKRMQQDITGDSNGIFPEKVDCLYHLICDMIYNGAIIPKLLEGGEE